MKLKIFYLLKQILINLKYKQSKNFKYKFNKFKKAIDKLN